MIRGRKTRRGTGSGGGRGRPRPRAFRLAGRRPASRYWRARRARTSAKAVATLAAEVVLEARSSPGGSRRSGKFEDPSLDSAPGVPLPCGARTTGRGGPVARQAFSTLSMKYACGPTLKNPGDLSLAASVMSAQTWTTGACTSRRSARPRRRRSRSTGAAREGGRGGPRPRAGRPGPSRNRPRAGTGPNTSRRPFFSKSPPAPRPASGAATTPYETSRSTARVSLIFRSRTSTVGANPSTFTPRWRTSNDGDGGSARRSS